jgi:DNA-dependent metalloprotease WSS1
MLHELSHIVHGPHDAKFHTLWDQLRDEHEALVRKGYTGEGFLSEGHRLGGRQIPMSEARRLARAAAEKRKVLSAGSGQRLGGAAPRPGEDIRNVIVNAIERRNKTLQGCGNTTHNDEEIREISDSATRNGFRTQAEEDAANEAAIAQALWELVQEEEKAKYGSAYIPPSAAHPEGNGGGAFESSRAAATGSKDAAKAAPRQPPPIPVHTKPEVKSSPPQPPPYTSPVNGWSCQICTLHNPAAYLICDACGNERPSSVIAALASQSNKRPRNVANLGASPARPSKSGRAKASEPLSNPGPSGPATWQCSFCGKEMERQWWTCSLCGKMKDSS